MRRSFTSLAGVALVVFLVAGAALSGSEPSATAAPAHVIAWYSAHSGRMKASVYLSSLGVPFGLIFFAYVRSYLTADERSRVWATAAFGGGVVFAAVSLMSLGSILALASDPGRLSADAAQALNVAQSYLAGLAINFGAAALLLATAAAAFASRRLPVAIRWLTVVLGLVSLIPVPNVGALTAALWALVTSIYLFASRTDQAVDREGALVVSR